MHPWSDMAHLSCKHRPKLACEKKFCKLKICRSVVSVVTPHMDHKEKPDLKEARGGDESWGSFVSVVRRHANPAAQPRSARWRVPAWRCRAVNQSWKAAGGWTPPLSLSKSLPLLAAAGEGPFLPLTNTEVFHRCWEKSVICNQKQIFWLCFGGSFRILLPNQRA